MIRKVLHHPLFKFFPYVRHMGSCRESISRHRPEILRKLLTKAKSILGIGRQQDDDPERTTSLYSTEISSYVREAVRV